jgi:hypothetical protein
MTAFVPFPSVEYFNSNCLRGAGIDWKSQCNTAVGLGAGDSYATTESNNIVIGSNVGGTAGENNTIRIGDNNAGLASSNSQTFINGISGATFLGGTSDPVRCNAAGQLGTVVVSSARYKKDIKPMDKASEPILALRPVTFHYKADNTNKLQFGLIAEEVAKVDPSLVVMDKEGKPYSVHYDDINIRLLNEFLKEHKKVEEQQASISQLKSEMQTMVAQLKEQAAQIQKVSAQLEVSKPAPQVVTNIP